MNETYIQTIRGGIQTDAGVRKLYKVFHDAVRNL